MPLRCRAIWQTAHANVNAKGSYAPESVQRRAIGQADASDPRPRSHEKLHATGARLQHYAAEAIKLRTQNRTARAAGA